MISISFRGVACDGEGVSVSKSGVKDNRGNNPSHGYVFLNRSLMLDLCRSRVKRSVQAYLYLLSKANYYKSDQGMVTTSISALIQELGGFKRETLKAIEFLEGKYIFVPEYKHDLQVIDIIVAGYKDRL